MEKNKIFSNFHESHNIFFENIYIHKYIPYYIIFLSKLSFLHTTYIYFLLSDLQFPSILFFNEYLFTSKWIQWKCRYIVATSGSDR